MYFSIVLTLLFGIALSAPQEMASQANDEPLANDEGYQLTEAPPSYDTDAPYGPTSGNEYEPKEPEYPAKEPEYPEKEAEYGAKEPEYMAKEAEYVTEGPQYGTDAPSYAAPEASYDSKEPEYATEEPEPTVVYDVVTDSSSSSPSESEPHPMQKQTFIINSGKHLSEAITAKIVGPVVLFNSKIAAAAGALPPMLAAKGAVIGSAIATPIEVGAVAGSSAISGVTGKLVAVPISLGAGALAKFVSAAEEGQQIWNFNVEHGGEVVKNGLIKLGHLILKPVAVVVGAKTALTGAGVGMFGTGVKGVGVGMEAVGAKMVSSGLIAKGLGHRLIAKNLPPYLK